MSRPVALMLVAVLRFITDDQDPYSLAGNSIVNGHEYSETITDQNPAGGWTDSSGAENADKCAWVSPGVTGGAANLVLATGSFAMQGTWGNDRTACEFTR